MKTILELKTWIATFLSGNAPETTQETPQENAGQETAGETAETPGEAQTAETTQDAETPGETQGAETPDENQETPEQVTARLDAREGELLTIGTQLQTLSETLNQREAALNDRETKLTEAESKLTEKTGEVENKEKTADALKQAVGAVTTPVAPEAKNGTAAIVAQFQAADPATRAKLYQKHSAILRAAKVG